ncbi:MAG TPA: SLBB domain-containing protein [Planctomycetota bacterium]
MHAPPCPRLRNNPFLLTAAAYCLLVLTFAAGAVAQEAADAYRFRGGERVKLFVPAAVGESIEQLVLADGWISLPTGNTINLKGKTLTEAQKLINEELTKQSPARQIYAALALLEIPPHKVYVDGEIKKPQAIVVPPGSSLSLAGALAAAEGLLPDADPTQIEIVQTTLEGKAVSVTFNASRFSMPGNTDLGPLLQPGAVVTIPRGDVFIVAGEVAKGGSFSRRELGIPFGQPATLTRVLFGSGGLKAAANRRDVRIIRTAKDGSREVLSVNLDISTRATKEQRPSAPEGPAAVDPILQNGDIVVASSAGGVSVLGRVRAPGVYPLQGDKMKLTRALALAGGFADFAKQSAVTVIRAAEPNKPQRVDVSVIAKEGTAQDLDLEDGDLVIVSERLL